MLGSSYFYFILRGGGGGGKGVPEIALCRLKRANRGQVGGEPNARRGDDLGDRGVAKHNVRVRRAVVLRPLRERDCRGLGRDRGVGVAGVGKVDPVLHHGCGQVALVLPGELKLVEEHPGHLKKKKKKKKKKEKKKKKKRCIGYIR